MTEFEKARAKLTLYYFLLSFVLLTFFSIMAIGAERTAFKKITDALSNPTERPVLTKVLSTSLNEFDSDFIKTLLIFDLASLIVAMWFGYYMSGQTLRPIAEMLTRHEEFSQDVSHELRTPLTNISLELEVLNRQSLDVETKKSLSSITSEVTRMQRLINGLLSLVHMQNPYDKSIFKPVDLVDISIKAFDTFKRLAEEKNITLHFKYSKKPILVTGISDQVYQLVVILLENAIKYTSSRGSVAINIYATPDSGIIEITDTGVGIKKSEQRNIFKRFYKGDKSLGFGLGLSIAQKIVKDNKGKLILDDTYVKGSKFVVSFDLLSSS